MGSRASGAVLFAQTTRLHAELGAVIERSRDLCWWAGQLRTRSASARPRTIRGGTSVDDAGLVVAMITGVWLCPECIAHRGGMPVPRVETILTTVAGTIALSMETRPCFSCLEAKKTYRFDGAAPHVGASETSRSNGTQPTILNFLAQHAGSAFCAACVSEKLFAGKDIDVAMRMLEGNGMYRRHGRCSACRKLRLVASLPASN